MRQLAFLVATAAMATACSREGQKASTDTAPSASAGGPPSGAPSAEVVTRTPPGAAPGPKLYVSNEASGDVSIIDLATSKVLGTLPVGKRPRGIQRAPNDSAVYVALSGSVPSGPEAKGGKPDKGDKDDKGPPADKSADGIGIIETRTGTLAGRLPSGSDPEQLAVSVDGSHLYISNEDVASMSIISLAGRKIEDSYKVGEEPEGVGASPDGKWVYVTCEATSDVHVFDTKLKKMVKKFAVPGRPRGVAFLSDSSRAYVTSETGGAVSVVSLPEHKVEKTLKPEGENVRPMGVVVSPDGKRAYVTTGHGGTVVVIDTKTDEIAGKVAVGKRPWGIVVSADGKTVYTANGPSDDVSVVDTETLTEKERIKVGSKPWGLVIVPSHQ